MSSQPKLANTRIKLIKDFGPYRQGQVINLPTGQAELLINQGIAVHSKDMVNTDMRTK